jgi:hypothetical protein
MSVPSYIGRYWLCPECQRHVPVRKDACMCGLDRTTVLVPVREALVHVPQSQPQESSAFATLWPFAVIAVFFGWIAYDGLRREPTSALEGASPRVAASGVATPILGSVEAVEAPDDATDTTSIPRTVEVVAATDDWTDTFSEQPSSLPPATPQPQIVRVQVPQPEIAPASRVWTEDEYERRSREEEAARRQQETEWRTRATRLIVLLRTTLAGYRQQVCSEARGGIAVSTVRDNTGAYMSARAEAQALEESARLAGVPPGWVRIPWGEFPEPEDIASGGYHPAAVADRWNCGNVTWWGH